MHFRDREQFSFDSNFTDVCSYGFQLTTGRVITRTEHDDVIKWKRFPRYWPFVRGIHRSPVNSPHKGQWRGALMFPKWLSKQSWGWWFETPSCPLWRYCNEKDLFSTHWDKMAAIRQTASCEMHFLEWKTPYFDSNFTEFCPRGSS